MTNDDRILGDSQTAAPVRPIIHVASFRNANPRMGSLAAFHYVYNVRIHVTEAFDNGATIAVGHPDDIDAYATATSVTSTGVKTPTLGAGIGYDAIARALEITITGSPTVGKAIVIVEFYLVPKVN